MQANAPQSGTTALKVIVAMGVLTFIVLSLIPLAFQRSLQPDEQERVRIRQKYSPFERDRAHADLEAIVAFGPRPAGSEAAAAVRAHLRQELTRAGLRHWDQHFQGETPEGVVPMVNLIAAIEGDQPGIIVIAAPYDTPDLPGTGFVGVNTGGAATAWLLEWARALGPEREGRTLWLVWFDGKEGAGMGGEAGPTPGGSAFLALQREAEVLHLIELMINVDMIGDCYLRISRDPGAPAWLEDILWDTGARLGYGAHFGRIPRELPNDHLHFREAGIPAILLMDFVFGGSLLEHQRLWHTAADALDKVCPESLQAVADVLYHALPALEAQLDSGEPRLP